MRLKRIIGENFLIFSTKEFKKFRKITKKTFDRYIISHMRITTSGGHRPNAFNFLRKFPKDYKYGEILMKS